MLISENSTEYLAILRKKQRKSDNPTDHAHFRNRVAVIF